MKHASNPNDQWLGSAYASQYFDAERKHLDNALRQAVGPAVLQVGGLLEAQVVNAIDLPWMCRAGDSLNAAAQVDLCADAAFLPFAEKSLSTVLLPHTLEQHSLPHQVLREAHRVLQPEGHLLLSGFNPYSLLGAQHKISRHAVPQGQLYSLKRVTDWLQLLSFDVLSVAMYQYAPLSKRPRTRQAFNFLETAGSRWVPKFGGAYMLTARKKEVGMTLIGGVKYRSPKRKFSAAPAKTSLKAGSTKSPTHSLPK